MKRISTFEQLLTQYALEKPLSEATIKTYRGVINCFTKDTGIKNINAIKFEKLLDWRISVILRSSDITWNNYLRHMRALWKFAILKHYVPDIDHFKNLHWGKYSSSRTKIITKKQLSSIYSFFSDKDCGIEPCWFWHMVIRFMFFTGVRRKQLITLKWKDVDFAERTIYLSPLGEKTDIARKIPMTDTLINEMELYRQTIMTHHPDYLSSLEKQLFNVTIHNSRYKGKFMTESQLSGFFRRLSQKQGFKVSAHRLRHTMATEIAKTGQIKPLQCILGHSDIGTTMNFYVHPDMEEMRESAACLEDI